jgi:acetate kinase
MKKVMVLNLGSTSFKFKLFDFNDGEREIAAGNVSNIGDAKSSYRMTVGDAEEIGECYCPSHGAAFRFCVTLLEKRGYLASLGDLDAVGYKAVHGGAVSGAQLVNDELLAVMESYIAFAPAHNPVYIGMMRELQESDPQLRQVAYFETSFHATIPEYRVVYGVPYEWREQYGIRRYGFHGSSHGYIAQKLRELEPKSKRVISVHLGGSSSLCAIRDGKSIASSMGATPQSGIFHNNRVGDFDVFCLPELVRRYRGDLDAVMRQLATGGGFLGLSGVSNDLRAVLQAREDGNQRAELAVRAFVDGIVGYIGMFTAYLGGLDVLVFTGGIGQHSGVIREMVCEALEFLSLELDTSKNECSGDRKISAVSSAVSVWVLKTNEELMVARRTRDLLWPA